MILDTALIKLEAVLAGAVSANQPEVHVDFIAHTDTGEQSNPSTYRTALNSTTDVSILQAPGTQGNTRSNSVLEPLFVSIYNKDTANVTVTVKTDDGTTERIIGKWLLATLEVLMYEKGGGWYVMTASGSIKQGSGVSGPASSTDNAVVRWDSTTGTIIQNSGVIVDDTNNVTGVVALTMNGLLDNSGAAGGQIKFPATQNASANANTLDDYEEGTWTIGVSFGNGTTGLTYSRQVATYTKVGNRPMVNGDALLSNKGSSTGTARVTGLPFTSDSTANNNQVMTCFMESASSLSGNQQPFIAPSATTATLYQSATGSGSVLTDTNFGNGTEVMISGPYQSS